jgi:AraC-like DNA-binding protein
MMKFIYIFLLFSNLIYAQKEPLDSLSEFNYLDLKNKFYEYYDDGKTSQSKLVARYYLQKAKKNKNKVEIAEGYVLMHQNEDFPNALKFLDSLQVITQNLNEKKYPVRTYVLKGNLFFKYDDQKKALENYITALKFAKEKNDKRQIALAEINIAYLKKYVGRHEEAEKILSHYLYHEKFLNKLEHNQIHLSLADTYIETNKLDSAYTLINEGLSSFNNKYDYLLLSGFYYLKIKDYKRSIEDLVKCKKYFLSTDNNERNIYYTLLYLGSSYSGLKEKEKAIQNFIEIDSIVKKTNNTFPELREVYTYLIDYYKENNNKEKQLYYIERFLKVDQKLDDQFKYISQELPQKYDTPKLLAEKQTIIRNLQIKKYFLYGVLITLIVLLLIVIIMLLRAKKTEKKYRKIAQDLIRSVEENKIHSYSPIDTEEIIDHINLTEINLSEEAESSIDYQTEPIESDDRISKSLSQEAIELILEALKRFESKEQYLKTGITLGKLAKNINTNTSYLSEVINVYKVKNFTSYINDLRIDYALNRLVHDKKFRSYKLPAIAEELGYNSVQSFHIAFKKKTGTTPSIYIKEIEKSLKSQLNN